MGQGCSAADDHGRLSPEFVGIDPRDAWCGRVAILQNPYVDVRGGNVFVGLGANCFSSAGIGPIDCYSNERGSEKPVEVCEVPMQRRGDSTWSLNDGSPRSITPKLPRLASLPYVEKGSSWASMYGSPPSPREAASQLPPGDGGLTWSALVVGEEWANEEHCDPDGRIRPRRSLLPVRASDFSKSLVKTKDGRWLFCGVLNGWPGLQCLEVHSIAAPSQPASSTPSSPSASPKAIGKGRAGGGQKQPASSPPFKPWSAGGATDPTSSLPSGVDAVEATLRMAPWTSFGWSRDSPGFVWWYFAQRDPWVAEYAFGEDILRRMKSHAAAVDGKVPEAVRAHIFAHRYALGGKKEDKRAKITYHAAVLLEWDHGHHMTVVELGPLNGVSGRHGRSDWFHDKFAPTSKLSEAMPACVVMPWKAELAEVRVSDVEAKTPEEFKAYVKQYTGSDLRFVDPQFPNSGSVRLSKRSQEDIARYLLNYMRSDQSFSVLHRSCQSFAADFYSLLVGDPCMEPFHPSLRKTYTRHVEWFLYDRELPWRPDDWII